MVSLLIKILKNSFLKMKKFLKKFYQFVLNKFNKIIDNSIQSIFSPQFFSTTILIILGTCFHQNIIDTITNAQAKILLQKENLNPLQYQITETWVATNTLIFLFDEYSKPKNKKKFKTEIPSAYEYWQQSSKNWKNNWERKFNKNVDEIKEEEKKKLRKQFNNIVEYFEDKFFKKINVCYKQYYSKNKSCATPVSVLPLPANITEFQRKIYQFYVNVSQAKKK